jgi:hypothetical protein
MLFATTSAEMVFFLMIVIPLSIMGFRKFGRWIDPKGEIKDATKDRIIDKIRTIRKK